MKILNIDSYPNLFNHFQISSSYIIDSIKEYKLSFPKKRDILVEWNLRLPTFINSFYKYLYNNNDILNQKDFFDYYMYDNKTYFDYNNFDSEILSAVMARVYRAYPSIVRDLHFNVLACEQLKGSTVLYNRKLDIEEGIDLLIKEKNSIYAVNLFTETPNSRIGREKKENRHKPFKNVNYIDLPISLNDVNRFGDFFLYGESQLDKIKKIIYLP
jgi:hypothetical protein